MKRHVLIIEDNPEIARLVALHLADIGCSTEICADGRAGVNRFRGGGFHLVVLDLMLPGMDGLAVCRALRAEPGYVPILMLTARSSELDRVLGLEMGADDYLTKPFSIPELVARIKALFRRVEAMGRGEGAAETSDLLEFEGLRIEVEKRQVMVDGEPVSLTAREFDLLLHFARHPGRVYSRLQLLEQVWGYNHEGYEHTVN
ncbi:MAG TPA: response regulator transcription factor, partial [Sedimenticola sp.]|nr:response regulator transcription factor [Sedimenticola sp.]